MWHRYYQVEMKGKLLPVLAFIALVLVSNADKLAELGEIWPTLTPTEKAIGSFFFILMLGFLFAVGWVILLMWTAMRRRWSRSARRG